MFNRILVICTGNICRSPMAEALLRERLRRRGASTTVESAGIAALVGRPADPLAITLMQERGIDISRHRGRQLTAELVHSFELLLVMELGQQKIIELEHPISRGRVHRIGRVGDFDVPDPFRRGREAFEASVALIETGLTELDAVFTSRR